MTTTIFQHEKCVVKYDIILEHSNYRLWSIYSRLLEKYMKTFFFCANIMF